MTAKKVATKVEYKRGDKVKILKVIDIFPKEKLGSIGTVLGNDGCNIGVEFDFNDPVLHSCGGACPNGHGYNFTEKHIEKAKRSHKKATPTVDRSVTPFVVGDVVELTEEYQRYPIGERGTVTRIDKKNCDENSGRIIKQIVNWTTSSGKTCGCYDVRLKLVKGAKSKAVAPELVEDPRTFYKVLRIDGCPANNDARRTGFKYTLPVEGPTEWTPKIESLILCERGYHIIEAKDIKRWVTSEYAGVDTIVCECKARGDIKQGDNKCVAESIQLTKILYRWKDAKKNYDRAEKIRGVERGHEMKELQEQFDTDRANINVAYDKSIKEMGDKFFIIGE